MSRKLLFAFGVLAVAVAPAVLAQAWPAKPVKVVVPFSTGTAADIAARQLAARLADVWGQGVVVENVMGAGGNIGAVTVAKAAPDGYTLLMAGINNVINPSLYADAGYDMARDFKPIARIAIAPLAFVANPAFPASWMTRAGCALAKAKPKTVLYGSGGNGSVTHLVFELLKTKTAIDMTHVPYKGIAQMMTDILGNQIPAWERRRRRARCRSSSPGSSRCSRSPARSARRSSPTCRPSPNREFSISTSRRGTGSSPARTPDEIVAKVYGDVAKIAQTREFVEAMQKAGLETDLMTPAEFRAFIGAELAKWSKLVKDSGAKLD